MSNNKNMLLGFGETLTVPISLKKSGGPKKKPYTYEENKKVILKQLEQLILSINKISPDALPDGKAVSKFVLHPTFLAKSYFPIKLLKSFSLECIGSKSLKIMPRKDNKNTIPKLYLTVCLYVSGKKSDYESLIDALKNNSLSNEIKKDIIEIEKISILDHSDKIKNDVKNKSITKIEIALHTPNSTPSVEKDFEKFALKNGVNIVNKKSIKVKGLTFMSFEASKSDILKLAEFSYLRTIRKLPKLRSTKPIFRSLENMKQLTLPIEPALNQELKVAIFDSGVGINDYKLWVNEINLVNNNENVKLDLSQHGLDVTSTVLFGLIDSDTEKLKIPYCNIDHYCVVESHDNKDIDLFDVLIRIKTVLEKKKYDYVNISLGPRLPIDDDDIHVWTSTLEEIFARSGTLCTVAAGNDGELEDFLNRIQPPADLINALSVGAATSLSDDWERCSYSCIGPGRSPGFVKPDGIAFGGNENEPLQIYNPITKGIAQVAGTSFAAPLVMRQAIALSTLLKFNITPLTAKALLIHHAESKKFERKEIGWGNFPLDLNNIIYCDSNQVKVIYQGSLEPSKYIRVHIPFPDVEIKGDIEIKATFCFTSPVDVEHPVNATRSGLEVIMRKNLSNKNTTHPFFNLKSIYADENEKRSDGHKWETTLHSKRTFRKTTDIADPCFDIIYYVRDCGMPIGSNQKLENLNYVLIVSLSIKNMPELYNLIRQKYQTLQPIEIQQQVLLLN